MKLEKDSLGNEIIPDKMWIDVTSCDRFGKKTSESGRVYKSYMMMLEMIANSNFSRPLYMSTTVGPSNYNESSALLKKDSCCFIMKCYVG